MKNKNIVLYTCYLIIMVITYIISFINEYNLINSFAFYGICSGIGLVISDIFRNRIKIIDRKKFKIDLFILLSIALIGSVFMSIFINNGKILTISVLSLNAISIVVFYLRNTKNLKSS
jgi:hypothetical protein